MTSTSTSGFKEAISETESTDEDAPGLDWARLRFHACPRCAEPLALFNRVWECLCWFQIGSGTLDKYLNAGMQGTATRFRVFLPYSIPPF